MLDKSYEPTMAGLVQATADLDAALASLPGSDRAVIMVAADEIFANIVHYSQATAWSLRVAKLENPDRVQLVFEDDGLAFDPLSVRDPDTSLSAEDRQIGGLGILIVKKTMSPITYDRRDGKNVLTMTKAIDGSAARA